MVGGFHVEAFIGLSHQVADINFHGPRGRNCLRYATHQQVGDKAGKEGTGAHGDHVCLRNCFQCLRQWLGSAGTMISSTMRCVLALMFVSPRTCEPSSIMASSCTLAEVAGRICARVARISDACLTATAKSPVIAVSAARNKLPKLWPSRSPELVKRY